MKAYPIFLLPKGEIMMTAEIKDNEIIITETMINDYYNKLEILHVYCFFCH
jgi:hypothetical protein